MGLQIQLRPAAASDQPLIRAMVRAERLNPLGLDWPNFVVAVEPAGRIVGCVQLKPHPGGIRELASLVVVSDWQNKGVARLLIEHCQREAGPPLWLMCRDRLVPLYRRFEFEAIEALDDLPLPFRRPWRVGNLLRRLPMVKEGLTIMRWSV